MSEKKLVPEGAFIACDKGSLPGQLTSGMIEQISIYGQKVITESDNVFMINFLPLGPCLCLHGQPCMAQPLLWDSLADGVLVGGSRPVLEDAKLPCALGGQISIFPTPAAALAVLPKAEQKEKSFWSKTLDFGTGLGKGLWTGAKGTATGVYDLGVWAGKHSLPYMLLNPEGYKEQLEQDVETAKALGSLAADAGTWAYRNSAMNQLTNPSDYAAVQQENAVMVGKVVEKAKAMDAEDWGNLTGQVGFEVLTEVATAGAGLVVTGMKAADRTVDVARAAEKVDDLADAARAADKLEDASDAARTSEAVEEGGDAAKAADKAEDVEDVVEEVAGPEPLGDVVYGGRVRMGKVVSAPFNRNPAHPYDDFIRQLRGQETGMNDLTVHDFISNRDEYIRTGRSAEGSRAQREYREQFQEDMIENLMETEGKSYDEAESIANEFMSNNAALHDPDQIAGGFGNNVTGMGDKRVNSSLGSQWKTRIGDVDSQVRQAAENMTDAEKRSTYLDIELPDN